MKVTLIAGLPGSGKTTKLQEMELAGAVTIDDISDLSELPERPVEWLAVADVNFCIPHVRRAAEAEIARRYGLVEYEWMFFANDPDACHANAERRDDGRNVAADIAAMSRFYVIPEGEVAIPVFRPAEEPQYPVR